MLMYLFNKYHRNLVSLAAFMLLQLIMGWGSLQAQPVFAPPGAEWYHSAYSGIFYSRYTGDTIITGINCRKVERRFHSGPPLGSMGYAAYDLSTLYLYNNSDTVFVFNSIFHRFTPLYVFNVTAGDTLQLPILPSDDCNTWSSCAGSTFSLLVDSVKMVLYDTAMLKTVYSHYLGNRFSDCVYIFGDTTVSTYAEKIGSLNSGIMPWYYTFGVTGLDFSCQAPGSLRCYSDTRLSVKLISADCDAPPLTIPAIADDGPFKVFPNPASDIVNVDLPSASTSTSIRLTDLNGKVVSELIPPPYSLNAKIDVSTLTPGMYFLSVLSSDHPPQRTTLTVMR